MEKRERRAVSVAAARRAPTCFGGWEYEIAWASGGERTWEPHNTVVAMGETWRQRVEQAQETKWRAASFREDMETRAEAGSTQAMRAMEECEAEEGGIGWEVWKMFLKHAEQHSPNGGEHNQTMAGEKAGGEGQTDRHARAWGGG